jgi:uncharacterized protein DUF4440
MNTEIIPVPATLSVRDPKPKLRTLFCVVALGIALWSACAAHAQSEDMSKKLIDLENAWVAALVKADTAKLDLILTETYVDTEEGGHRSDKRGTLEMLKSRDLKLTSIKLSNMKVYGYGDAAVVTGMAAQDGTFKGESIKGDIVFTDTFVLQNGTWKAAASQRTTAPK